MIKVQEGVKPRSQADTWGTDSACSVCFLCLAFLFSLRGHWCPREPASETHLLSILINTLFRTLPLGHQCRIIVVTWVVDSTEPLEEILFWTIPWTNLNFCYLLFPRSPSLLAWGFVCSFACQLLSIPASIPALRGVYLRSPVYSSCGVLFVWLLLCLVWNMFLNFDSALPFPAFGSWFTLSRVLLTRSPCSWAVRDWYTAEVYVLHCRLLLVLWEAGPLCPTRPKM